MRLMSSVLGFALRQLGLLAALVLCLFLVLLLTKSLIPAVSDAVDQRNRLPQVRTEVEEARRQVSAKESELEDLREDLCGLKGRLFDAAVRGAPCKAAQDKVDRAEEELKALRGGLVDLQRTEDRLERAQASWQGRVLDQWFLTWKWLLALAVLVVVMPYVLRTVSYFLLLPVVHRAHKPIHLAAGRENATADLRHTAAERTLTVELSAGEVLSARSEHVRPVQGKVRSQLLYQWTSPFISFAAGLYFLSQITGGEGGTSATLGTPDDPDSYLMRIDFQDHPGVVMHPKNVVGVIGTPELTTRWRWGIQSLATWQVRYIMFAGTGSLVVQGSGDVAATNPGGSSTRMDQHLVMGFDSRLTVGVNRTDVFISYLRGKAPLVDDDFTGSHLLFWQKSSADGPSNPLARSFNAVFSGLGKLFGF